MDNLKPMSVTDFVLEVHKLKEFPTILKVTDIMKMRRCSRNTAVKYRDQILAHFGKKKGDKISLEQFKAYFGI